MPSVPASLWLRHRQSQANPEPQCQCAPQFNHGVKSSSFWAFADAGQELARLHLDYEKLEPYEVFDYRLGNRSALDWVIDQYQVSEDKRSGIRSDPNRAGDPEYIVRLVGQVVRVSLETMRIVNGLPERYA